MDTRPTHRRLNDRGFSSLQFLLASGLALIFFAALANVIVVQYARGSVRSALDQGVRSGAINRSTDVCETRIGDVVDSLLGGVIGDSVDYECHVDGTIMVATGSVSVESWTPFTGDFVSNLEAGATIEPDV